MFEDKIKVVPFNDLSFEERRKINFYLNEANVRTLQQVNIMLKDSIGEYQKRKIRERIKNLKEYVKANYEIEKGGEEWWGKY